MPISFKYKESCGLIAVLFIVITCISGCFTIKTIPKSGIGPDGKKYFYVHSGGTVNRITNIEVNDTALTGTIDNGEVFHEMNRQVDIYVAADPLKRLNEKNELTIPLDYIVKVDTYRLDIPRLIRNIAGFTGYIGTAYLTIWIIAWSGPGGGHPAR